MPFNSKDTVVIITIFFFFLRNYEKNLNIIRINDKLLFIKSKRECKRSFFNLKFDGQKRWL